MMRTLAKVLLALAAILCLAAIWLPAHWWQLLLTALVVLFVGAGILGPKAKAGKEPGSGAPRRHSEDAEGA